MSRFLTAKTTAWNHCIAFVVIIGVWGCNESKEIKTKHIETRFASFDIPEPWSYIDLTDSSRENYPLFILQDSFKDAQSNIFASFNITLNISSFKAYMNEEVKALKKDIEFKFVNATFVENDGRHQCNITATTFDRMLNQERELLYCYYFIDGSVYVLMFNTPSGESKYNESINLIKASLLLKPFSTLSMNFS